MGLRNRRLLVRAQWGVFTFNGLGLAFFRAEAIRWMRGHAKELGMDPDRISAIGSSAGGHLSWVVSPILRVLSCMRLLRCIVSRIRSESSGLTLVSTSPAMALSSAWGRR
ncbi:MAG: alpha/beta hydrolase fold domain-containing protein [Planctomycetota bacterium]